MKKHSRLTRCMIIFSARLIISFLLFLPAKVFTSIANATISDGNADIALGQPDLNTSYPNVVTNNRFNQPYAAVPGYGIDRIFVVDTENSRVLFWNYKASLVNGQAADGVIGQADFTQGKPNRGGAPGPDTLNKPCSAASFIDELWVADCGNNRVLRFVNPPATGATANLVLGQANFISTNTNSGGSTAANTLSNPSDVAIKIYSPSDIWVADRDNNRVLKFNRSTLANGVNADLVLGQGDFISNSNFCGQYSMRSPEGVSVDDYGNVWVADTSNNRALKFNTPSSNGEGASIAFGQADFTSCLDNRGAGYGGVAANTLYYPTGVSVNTAGDIVWVSDKYNYRLLKYLSPFTTGQDATLVIGHADFTSYAQPGYISTNTLYLPEGVYMESTSGDLWVADTLANRILKFNNPASNGPNASLVLGQPDFISYRPNLIEAKGLMQPRGVVYDPKYGRVFVGDSSNCRILWWNSASALSTGKPADGVIGQVNFTDRICGTAKNKLNGPAGISVDASGNLWVVDSYNSRVVRYSGASISNGMDADLVLGQADFVSGSANRGGAVSANTMSNPWSVAVDKTGNVWVADTSNHRVLGFLASGLANGVNANFVLGQANFLVNSSNRGGSINDNTLSVPSGVYVDSATRIWIADAGNGRALRFDAPSLNEHAALVLGANDFTHGGGGGGPYKLATPRSVAVDPFGNVWVADTGFHRITEYIPPLSNGMQAGLVIGQANYNSYECNSGVSVGSNTLCWPGSLTFDNLANLYAADTINNRVTVYNSGLQPPPAPVISKITPSSGLNISAIQVIIEGTNFASGMSVKLAKTGQADIEGTNINVLNANKLTCDFNLTGAATGTWNITVTNLDDNSATLPDGFTVRLPAPAVSSVNPPSGLNYTALSGVSVNGAYFLSGATVKLTKAGQGDIAATDVVFVNSTQLTCTLPISSAVTGAWNVVVINPDAQSGTLGNGFTTTVDATPPAGVPATPSAGIVYTSSTTITFNWDRGTAADPESGISGYYLQAGHNPAANDAGVFDDYVGDVSSKTFTSMLEGAYYARVKAKNGYSLYGDYSPWSAGVFIDTTPPPAPVIESLTHQSSSTIYLAGNVTFTLSAQDATGIAGYYYIIDQLSGTVPDYVPGAYFTGATTSMVLSDGLWFAHFVAVDMAGNIGGNAGQYSVNIGNAINISQDNVFQAGDGTTVAIPAGALSTAADILISVPPTVPPAPKDGTVKDIGISKEIKLSDPALTLQKNITISLSYSDSQVSSAVEDLLKLSYYGAAKERWEIIYDSVVDKIKNTVTAAVNHLSLFKIVAYTPQSEELASVSNYPNPFTAGRGGTTKIHYSLKANSDVEIWIYDLLGKLVWHKTLQSGVAGGSLGVNDVAWDGKNDEGAYVGAGAYICIIKAGSEKKKVKIAVK